MIRHLETPETATATVLGQSVTVLLTHECWEYTLHGSTGVVRSRRYLGQLIDGVFKPFHSRTEDVAIAGADYEALTAPTPAGKPAGHFRTDDVMKKHAAIRARG